MEVTTISVVDIFVRRSRYATLRARHLHRKPRVDASGLGRCHTQCMTTGEHASVKGVSVSPMGMPANPAAALPWESNPGSVGRRARRPEVPTNGATSTLRVLLRPDAVRAGRLHAHQLASASGFPTSGCTVRRPELVEQT